MKVILWPMGDLLSAASVLSGFLLIVLWGLWIYRAQTRGCLRLWMLPLGLLEAYGPMLMGVLVWGVR